MEKILLIEDDVQLNQQLKLFLGEAGYNVIPAMTTDEGMQRFEEAAPDLILLDVMIPTVGGYELCQRLRERTHAPIILVTALDQAENVVKGLKVGADDYITKPFNYDILSARIAAHIRRNNGYYNGRYVFGDNEIVIDLTAHSNQIRGKEVEFTPREYSLLITFIENAGKVISTEDLLAKSWGEVYRDTPENIKPYIHYLRKKIEADPSSPKWINTVRGVGYRFGH